MKSGIAAAAARLALPIDLVTGLIMAAPVIVAAAVCLPREALRGAATSLVACVSAVTFVGVSATQHESGGGGEWGGRYYHVVLPLVCVLAVVALDWLVAHRGTSGRVVVACGVAVSLALSVLAVRESDGIREVSRTLTETAWRT